MSSQKLKVIGIRLSKEDDDLKQWLKLVKKKKLKQSLYFKKAILAYIKHEKIEIGRINKVENVDGAEYTSLTLTQNDVELLNFCIEIEKQPGIKLSTILKQIFMNAINYTDGEEYIPSFLELCQVFPSDVISGVKENKSSSFETPNSIVETNKTQPNEYNQSANINSKETQNREENNFSANDIKSTQPLNENSDEIAIEKENYDSVKVKAHPLLGQMFNFGK